MDQWKVIEGYEDYRINQDSVLVSCKFSKEIILKPFKSNGYFQVELSKSGKRKTFLLHRLVALTFIPNPENKPQVNHINGVKTDNRLCNLEWNTPEENMGHAMTNNLWDIKGENHYRSKLTNEAVLFIRDCSTPSRSLAKKYGVNKSIILDVRSRKTWKHL